jgi:ferredoxin
MDDEASVIEGADFSSFESGIKDAAESCPAEVIKYE